jgi:hypothetical protein
VPSPAAARRPPLEEPLGIVYWRTLQLVLPAGWTAVAQVSDPFLGVPRPEGTKEKRVVVVPLVLPFPDGRLHMMGPQAQFERRFVLMPTAAAKTARVPGAGKGAAKGGAGRPLADPSFFDPGLSFSANGKDLWSWFDPETARYFPQRDLLASFDLVKANGMTGRRLVRSRLARELADLREAVSAGIPKGYYVVSPNLGWAHPWWVKEPGSQGGEGIATCEGYYAVAAAAREQVDSLSLLHRMNVCRQPQAAYDRFGDPVGYHAWLDADGKIPFDFRLSAGVVMPPFLLPCRRGPAASEQVRAVVEKGLRPPYDLGDPFEPDGTWPDRADCLLAWSPHDDQHYIRYTKQPKALVWLTNDSMAKDDLLLAAELYHLARHESPHVAAHVDAPASPGPTLEVWEKLARAHPHQGLPLGREDAWGIDAMCAAYSVADPDWRKRNEAWFGRMAQLMLDGAMPSGIVQRTVDDQLFGHVRYAATQTFESLLLIHAMRCLNESVFRGVDDARRDALEKLAVKGVDYLFFGPPWMKVANSWQPYPANPTLFLQGPRQAIAVAPNDDYKSPPFCAESPDYLPPEALGLGVEWYHPWAALSYAQEITDSAGPATVANPYVTGPIDDGKPRPETPALAVDPKATVSKAGSGLMNRYLRRAIDCGRPHRNWRELVLDFMQQASDRATTTRRTGSACSGRSRASSAGSRAYFPGFLLDGGGRCVAHDLRRALVERMEAREQEVRRPLALHGQVRRVRRELPLEVARALPPRGLPLVRDPRDDRAQDLRLLAAHDRGERSREPHVLREALLVLVEHVLEEPVGDLRGIASGARPQEHRVLARDVELAVDLALARQLVLRVVEEREVLGVAQVRAQRRADDLVDQASVPDEVRRVGEEALVRRLPGRRGADEVGSRELLPEKRLGVRRVGLDRDERQVADLRHVGAVLEAVEEALAVRHEREDRLHDRDALLRPRDVEEESVPLRVEQGEQLVHLRGSLRAPAPALREPAVDRVRELRDREERDFGHRPPGAARGRARSRGARSPSPAASSRRVPRTPASCPASRPRASRRSPGARRGTGSSRARGIRGRDPGPRRDR